MAKFMLSEVRLFPTCLGFIFRFVSIVGFLLGTFPFEEVSLAEGKSPEVASKPLREMIVSHSDENGVLQLFRMKEDGSARRQITQGKSFCVMPAWSPDGKKVVYVQRTPGEMAICLTDPEGKRTQVLTKGKMLLVPSWLPDSEHIVWMDSKPGKEPSSNSQLHIMNVKTLETRRLFSDPEQLKFSNSMPVVSPNSKQVAFVSNRSGEYRIWVSQLDGSEARLVSPAETEFDKTINAPIEQKVPAWSPDGKWIAHWEGVEMTHLSHLTGKKNPKKDKLITATWHVWVVGSDGKNKRKVGRGDDPTWSPDGFVTRSFPDPHRNGPKVMIETQAGEKELPLVPPGTNYARFTWKP